MITKLLVSATIALGAAVGVAAPALADPSTEPNPFDSASCADPAGCQRTFLGTQTVSEDEMTAQMQAALAALKALPQHNR